MKKVLALVLMLATLTMLLAANASAAESFDYAHIVASGNDPYGDVALDKGINPDEVKWAVIKYRTDTQKDDTGVDLVGQIYTSPRAAEPHVPIKWNHTKNWELIVVDMTTCSKTTDNLPTRWTSATAGASVTKICFDPMESNRDAEANEQEGATPKVIPDSAIDVAFIAFFKNEADAKAYDGSNKTPDAIVTAAELAKISAYNVGATLVAAGSNPGTLPVVKPKTFWNGASLKATVAPGGNNMEVVSATDDFLELKVNDANDPFIALAGTANGGTADASVPPSAKYAVIMYQSDVDQNCEMFCGFQGFDGGETSEGFTLKASSDWAAVSVDLSNGGTAESWGDAGTNFRFDLSAVGNVKIKAVYFFENESDADMLAAGTATLDAPKAPNTSDVSVIVIAAIAVLSLAGVAFTKKVKA